MKDLLNQLLTGRDNKTHDIARWSWFITTVVIIVGAIWNTYYGHVFSMQDFAKSIGIIAGAHGASVFMKKDSEPSESPTNEEK